MLDKYIKAGKIASKIRNKAIKKVKAGMKVIDVINYVENEIIKSNAGLAFPCNISINQISSHYTSPLVDNTVLCNGDIVKIDLGVEVDGYIADTAETTIITGDNAELTGNMDMPGRLDDGNPMVTHDEIEERRKLIIATNAALENVTSIIRDGTTLDDIGSVVEDTITSYGFKPIRDLTGHELSRYRLHTGLQIPSYSNNDNYQLKEGDCIAVEPFATDGVGLTCNLPQEHIYTYFQDRPFRQQESQELLKFIQEKHSHLPFAKRHLLNKYTSEELENAIKPLITSMAIYPYKVLREQQNGMTSQTEHTIIVEKDSCRITTI